MDWKRLTVPLLLGAVLSVAGCSGSADPGGSETVAPAGSAPCQKVSLVGQDDPIFRSAYYALEQDKVKSDLIPDVEVQYLSIPAAIQATQSGAFDFIGTSLQGVVLARQSGLDLRIAAFLLAHTGGGLSFYVRSDSGINTAKDLVGRTVATPSLGSTGTTEAQIVLAEKYGLQFALEGGDLTWTELDPPTQLNALKNGDIDAALMWNQAKYRADQDPSLRNLAQLDADYKEVTGSFPIGVAVVAKGDYVDANPKCAAEMQNLIAESATYFKENIDSLAPEVAAQTRDDVEYIKEWWDPTNYVFGGEADATWRGYADAYYSRAAKYGIIPAQPNLDEIVIKEQ